MLIYYAATVPATNPVGTLAVVVAKDVALSGAALALDGVTGGQVARAIAAARFDGDAASLVEIFAPVNTAATRILVAGLGPVAKADASVFEKIGGAIAARLITSGEKSVTVDLSGVEGLAIPLADAAARIAHGATLRAYRFDKYRTTMKAAQKPTLEAMTIVGGGDTAAAQANLAAIAAGVALTRDLVSEPANIIYPESYVERVAAVAPAGLAIEVLGEAEMTRLGMGALLGVSQGSDRDAKILVMRWNGGGNAVPVILVGKGVTFDTGGISLKQPSGMEDMKWDMGGAGAVAGALLTLALRKAEADVIGVVGLVENMPDGNAQRPGDVVTSMSGQTIEVINTDAEGRLVLCDVLTWVQSTYTPATIVDLATLTGAIMVSLGTEYGGIFANDDLLASQLDAAGKASGDKLWRMPMGPAYDKLIDSPIADMKNVGPRLGGSITAAQFLKRFINDGVAWAHLDIAGMVWADKPGATFDKGATGFGVRLLDRYVRDVLES